MIPGRDEKQPVLEVLYVRQLQYFVVVVDDLLADLFGRYINHDEVLVLESKQSRQLAVLSLC